jgi:hypothetical protein
MWLIWRHIRTVTVANVNERKNVVQHVPDNPECDTGGVTPTERI